MIKYSITGQKIVKHIIILATAALILTIPFLQPAFGWASPLCVLPIIFLLERSDKLSTKAFLWSCYGFGLIYFATVMAWIYRIHATELIENRALAGAFIVLTFILVMSALALGFVLSGWLYRRLQIKFEDRTVWLIPVIWIVGEGFRSIFFSVFSLGPGGSVGLFWNFGVLGFAASNTLLVFASRIVGLFGTSFLIVLTSLVIYKLLRQQWRFTPLLLIPVCTSLLGWGLYYNSNGQAIRVAAVGLQSDSEKGFQDSLKKKIAEQPKLDATILPEYSYFFANSLGDVVKDVMPDNAGLVIDSRRGSAAQGHKNIVTAYQYDGKILAERQKSFLIPAGEFVPYGYQYILVISGNSGVLRSIDDHHKVEQAVTTETPITYHGVKYGALACSGAIAPGFYASITAKGAEVLTNSASLSTLGISDMYYRQASQMSSFIATSNARPFVQSARGGPSYILNKDGKVQTRTKIGEVDVAVSSLTTNHIKTLYTLLGEWLLYIAFGVITSLFVARSNSFNRMMSHIK